MSNFPTEKKISIRYEKALNYFQMGFSVMDHSAYERSPILLGRFIPYFPRGALGFPSAFFLASRPPLAYSGSTI